MLRSHNSVPFDDYRTREAVLNQRLLSIPKLHHLLIDKYLEIKALCQICAKYLGVNFSSALHSEADASVATLELNSTQLSKYMDAKEAHRLIQVLGKIINVFAHSAVTLELMYQQGELEEYVAGRLKHDIYGEVARIRERVLAAPFQWLLKDLGLENYITDIDVYLNATVYVCPEIDFEDFLGLVDFMAEQEFEEGIWVKFPGSEFQVAVFIERVGDHVGCEVYPLESLNADYRDLATYSMKQCLEKQGLEFVSNSPVTFEAAVGLSIFDYTGDDGV